MNPLLSQMDGILDFLLRPWLLPLVAKLPARYKTLLGVSLWVLIAGCRDFLLPTYPNAALVAGVLEYVAVAIFGIGVFHKVEKTGGA